MPDATDPDAPNADSSPNDRDWYVQQWEALCEELGTSDPNELLARVQTLKRQMERSDQAPDEGEGLVTISEVEEVFRELNSKIAKLRERNAALAKRLESDDDSDGTLGRLHRQTETLFDTLGVTTFEEAQERVEGLNDRIEELYQEKEPLVQAGFSPPADALDEIEQLQSEIKQLRAEREQLQKERDQLQQKRNQLQQEEKATGSASDGPDTSALDAATALREQGIKSPAQVEALSRVVENLHERIRDWVARYGSDTEAPPDSVIGMLRHISNYLADLPDPDALPTGAADALGASTVAEAETLADLVHRIAEQFADALEVDPDTLSEVDARTLLYALEDTDLAAAADASTSDSPAPSASSGDALPAKVGDILGIRTVEDARELEALIGDMSAQLDQLRTGHQKLDDAGLSADSALSMIENMEAQLADLYHHSDSSSPKADPAPSLDTALLDRIDALLEAPTDAADDLSAVVHRLVDRLETLSDEHAGLTDAGLTAPEALERINDLEDRVHALQEGEASSQESEAAQQLAAIDDVLGISTREEAEELSEIAHQMEEQLTSLYDEKQKLRELGLSSIEDAVDMITSMEEQLDDLYEDKEALRGVQDDSTDQQSTFQQLEALYAERQKLQQALGVSDAEDVIEMVETLTSQLDDLYTGRDAEVDPEERQDAQLWSPEVEDSTSEEAPDENDPEDEAPTPETADPTITLTSMEQQLESLYREKEVLLEQGFGSAEEAVTRLQTQRRQIDVLQQENHSYRQRFDQLKSELGTKHVPVIVELVHLLETEAGTSIDDLDLSSDLPSTPDEYGVDIDAAAPLVSPETLEHLADEDDALSDLDVGAIRLNDDGTVAALNERALQLPGLEEISDRDAVIGKNFFDELAPSTNNNLFFGRFRKGLSRDALDARFPYTFTGPAQDSQSFLVHLYRAPGRDTTWLFFRPS